MSGRCKACNNKLEEFELRISADSSTLEELCYWCWGKVEEDLEDKSEYEEGVDHKVILDNLTQAIETYNE